MVLDEKTRDSSGIICFGFVGFWIGSENFEMNSWSDLVTIRGGEYEYSKA